MGLLWENSLDRKVQVSENGHKDRSTTDCPGVTVLPVKNISYSPIMHPT